MALSAHTIQSLAPSLMNVDAARSLEASIRTLDTNTASLLAGIGPPTPPQASNNGTIATANFVNLVVYSTGAYYSTAGGL